MITVTENGKSIYRSLNNLIIAMDIVYERTGQPLIGENYCVYITKEK